VAWQKLVISGGGGGGSQPVPIGLIEVNGNTVTITFKGSAGSTVASFTVLAATSALGPYGPISATISAVGNNGEYIATVTAGAVPQFYRVVEGSTTPPPSDLNIESLSVQGSTVTLLFTGTSTDTASMFTVLGNSTAAGTYLPVNGATVAQDGSAGHFKATFPTNAPIQFYKVRK